MTRKEKNGNDKGKKAEMIKRESGNGKGKRGSNKKEK
jgi:hypothetical protein